MNIDYIYIILYVKIKSYKVASPTLTFFLLFIDPLNKSNICSFPLLTTYPAFEILLKTYSFNDVNSGKLYILDLLKGSVSFLFVCFVFFVIISTWFSRTSQQIRNQKL